MSPIAALATAGGGRSAETDPAAWPGRPGARPSRPGSGQLPCRL